MTEVEVCRRCDEPVGADRAVMVSDWLAEYDVVFCSARCLAEFESAQETVR